MLDISPSLRELISEHHDRYQLPSREFGNKQPGTPCGKAYISPRKQCSKGNAKEASKRLKGTDEGERYANKVRKAKGLKPNRENLTKKVDRQIKEVRAIKDPLERYQAAQKLLADQHKYEDRWSRDGFAGMRRKVKRLVDDSRRAAAAKDEPSELQRKPRQLTAPGKATLFRTGFKNGPAFVSIDRADGRDDSIAVIGYLARHVKAYADGQECGASFISESDTCHIGQGSVQRPEKFQRAMKSADALDPKAFLEDEGYSSWRKKVAKLEDAEKVDEARALYEQGPPPFKPNADQQRMREILNATDDPEVANELMNPYEHSNKDLKDRRKEAEKYIKVVDELGINSLDDIYDLDLSEKILNPDAKLPSIPGIDQARKSLMEYDNPQNALELALEINSEGMDKRTIKAWASDIRTENGDDNDPVAMRLERIAEDSTLRKAVEKYKAFDFDEIDAGEFEDRKQAEDSILTLDIVSHPNVRKAGKGSPSEREGDDERIWEWLMTSTKNDAIDEAVIYYFSSRSDSFPVGPTLDAIVSKSRGMVAIEFADMPSSELQMELNELHEKISPYTEMGEEPRQGKSFYLALPEVYCPSRTAEGIAQHLEKQYKMRVQRRELKQPAIAKGYEPKVVEDFAKAEELKEMRRDAIAQAIIRSLG